MKKQLPAKQEMPAGLALPLYALFESVRELDLQTSHNTVDMQSYFLLTETLIAGYFLNSREELLLLCEKLWIKPYHRQRQELTREKISRLIDEHLSAFFTSAEQPAPEPTITDASKKIRLPKPKPGQEKPPVLQGPREMPASAEDWLASRQTGALNFFISPGKVATGDKRDIPAAEVDNAGAGNFLTKGRYLPVTARRIEQAFRSYRFPVTESRSLQVDMEKTIGRIARNRFFDQFEYSRDKSFATSWTLLTDHSDSMTAFQYLDEEIRRVVTENNFIKKEQEQVYYFKNYPAPGLFIDPALTHSLPFAEFASRPRMNILILSDAGAARGFYNENRIMETIGFLNRLKKHRIAWLNPMPVHRWRLSSAEMIARFVPMFELGEGNSDGLGNIIRLFKSKGFS